MTPSGRPFGADRKYLCGFAFGDLHTEPHGLKVRVEASSTHPAQLSLITGEFDQYCRQVKYAIKTPNGFAWRLVYDLDAKFDFLLHAREMALRWLRSRRCFYRVLSGIVDAEGHVGIHGNGPRATPVVKISNSDIAMVVRILLGLRARGFRVSLTATPRKPGYKQCFEITTGGKGAVRLLRRLSLRHREKVDAKEIILRLRADPPAARAEYVALRKRILVERNFCIEQARLYFNGLEERKMQKLRAYNQLAGMTKVLRDEGRDILSLTKTLGKSQRTVYRLLRRAKIESENSANKPTRRRN